MGGIVREVVVMLVLTPFVFGQTGDAIFAQSYDFSSVDGGTSYASLADDFTPDFTGCFQYVIIYQYFNETPPTEVFLEITQDAGGINPNNATSMLSGSFAVSYLDTGDLFAGKPIYEMTIDLGQTVEVDAGNLYWLETGVVFNSFVLYQDPVVFGSPMWYFEGGQYHCFSEQSHSWDSFFELLTPVALQRNSWGSIKASF
ncbi:MAG: hypothetical protein B1H09_04335 [Gemmatimonadaceae bacterium 4484_173]|nr:MAG: hypothetical protein B1H09_04335 [Gemmatimonadaceae bacterium 4484_173]